MSQSVLPAPGQIARIRQRTYLVEQIPGIHFSNVIFWFASVVGVLAYAVSHWQSFRRNLIRHVKDLDVGALVFDTLQTSILIAVIFCAGATLQAVAMLALHLMGQEAMIGAGFGEKLLAIVLLIILASILGVSLIIGLYRNFYGR